MSTSVRIRREDGYTEKPQGGLIGAMVGGTTHIPGGSIEIEFQTDDIEPADVAASARWIEDVAPTASAAFRHADTGEMVTTFEGVIPVDVVDADVPQSGADDPHPFEREDDRQAEPDEFPAEDSLAGRIEAVREASAAAFQVSRDEAERLPRGTIALDKDGDTWTVASRDTLTSNWEYQPYTVVYIPKVEG